MGCPLQSDNGLSDFKAHPNLVKAWCRAGKRWMSTHPKAKSIKKFGNVYRLFVHNVFFKSYDHFMAVVDGICGHVDCKQFLEDYFKIRFDE